MNEIAVLVNDQEVMTSFEEKGTIIVYKLNEDSWIPDRELKVDLHSSENPRNYLKVIGEWILPCKNIVCSKMIGIAYQIFERLFFDIYEVEGDAEGIVEYIYKESLIQQEEGESIYSYIVDKEDKVSVDLVKIMELNSEMSSKKILQPILKSLDNKTLLVKCSHTPPWIKKMDKSNTINLFERKDEENILLTILHV